MFTDDSTWLETRAQSIGRFAFEVLSEDREASILGVTSRGIFVRAAGRWAVFLSFETYRSPLTITLSRTVDRLARVKVGSPARVVSGRLILPSAGIAVTASPSAVWHQPVPSGTLRPLAEQLADLKHLAVEAAAGKNGDGLSALLPPLLDLERSDVVASGVERALADLSRLRQALADRSVSEVARLIEGLLGKGLGLTPAWDDFVVGLLLLLNRRQQAMRPDDDLQWLNRQVVEAAYARTTRLSANLIECASLGESDERLVNVVDCILTGSPCVDECLPHLLTWGHSSGVDALAGMTVAVLGAHH